MLHTWKIQVYKWLPPDESPPPTLLRVCQRSRRPAARVVGVWCPRDPWKTHSQAFSAPKRGGEKGTGGVSTPLTRPPNQNLKKSRARSWPALWKRDNGGGDDPFNEAGDFLGFYRGIFSGPLRFPWSSANGWWLRKWSPRRGLSTLKLGVGHSGNPWVKNLSWVVVLNIFSFTPIWGHDPIWLLFFEWVETTN